jgi:succinate--hydroxymethylglutarate CoA-transferase
VIIAYADDMWARCIQALGASHMDRLEFRTAASRRLHRERLVAELSAVTSVMSGDEIMSRLGSARVVVSKVNSVAEAATHPQLAAVDGVFEFEVNGTKVKSVAPPFEMERTPAAVRMPPPALGAHTIEVFREFGFSDEEIASLRSSGAIGAHA